MSNKLSMLWPLMIHFISRFQECDIQFGENYMLFSEEGMETFLPNNYFESCVTIHLKVIVRGQNPGRFPSRVISTRPFGLTNKLLCSAYRAFLIKRHPTCSLGFSEQKSVASLNLSKFLQDYLSNNLYVTSSWPPRESDPDGNLMKARDLLPRGAQSSQAHSQAPGESQHCTLGQIK